MLEINGADRSPSALARRALLIATTLAMAGSGLGVVGAIQGAVAGVETVLVTACLLFTSGTLITLLAYRNVALQPVATASTAYFAMHLCAGSIIAVTGTDHHLNLFVYLLWFFPLLGFNKLVNAPAVGRLFAKGLLLAPLLILGCSALRLIVLFKVELLFMLVAYCLSYVAFGLMFDVVARYREEYIIERQHAESLIVQAEVLESISDCFISLDSESRLTYLNDAACNEFSVERRAALKTVISSAVPGFFSPSMLAGLEAASGRVSASMFEAQNQKLDLWYEMRCFPRLDGMSIYFRNITESMSSRRKLTEAHTVLREQAELLDKAQDAIVVQNMDHRILYWNKSAERLYGWTAEEVTGRLAQDIFHDTAADMDKGAASVLEHGEWGGELSQRHRDGGTLIVESRCTLVRGEDGKPRSILAINTDITKSEGGGGQDPASGIL